MPWEGSNLHKRSIAACLLCTADCHCAALLSNASYCPDLSVGLIRASLLESRHGGRGAALFKDVPCSGGYTVPKDTESERESFIEILITGWKVDLSKVWKRLLGLERVDQKVEGGIICFMKGSSLHGGAVGCGQWARVYSDPAIS